MTAVLHAAAATRTVVCRTPACPGESTIRVGPDAGRCDHCARQRRHDRAQAQADRHRLLRTQAPPPNPLFEAIAKDALDAARRLDRANAGIRAAASRRERARHDLKTATGRLLVALRDR